MSDFPKIWGQGDSLGGEKELGPLAQTGSSFGRTTSGSAQVELAGRFRSVTLKNDEQPALRYEFFLPEAIPLGSWPSGSTAYATQDPSTTDNKGVAAGNACSWRPGGKCHAIFSNTLTPGPDQHWHVRAIWPLLQVKPAVDARGVVRAPSFFASWPSWQNQMAPEHVHYPDNEGRRAVVSVRGYGYGLANNAGFWGPNDVPGIAGPIPGETVLLKYHNDVGKDIAATLYDGSGLRAVGAPLLPDYIDWRRAATIQASSGRRFFVLTDTHGYFHFYLCRDYTDNNFRALPQTTVVKSYLPPYPAWMTAGPGPTGTTSRSGTMREAFLWQFSADGKKAVGVPFNEFKGRLYINSGGAATLKAFYIEKATGFVHVLSGGETEAAFDADPSYTAGQWQIPGLVELAISITDPGDDTWEAALTLRDSSNYDNDGRYFVDAAYLSRARHLGDGAAAQLGAPEGTLLTAELEVWWDPTSTYPKIGRNTAGENPTGLPAYDVRAAAAATQDSGMRNLGRLFYTVRRRDTNAVVRRFQLSTSFGAKCPGNFASHIGVSAARNVLQHADLRSGQFFLSCVHASGKLTLLVYAWNKLEASVTNRTGTIDDAIADAKLLDAPPGAPLVQLPGADASNQDTAMFFLQAGALYLIDPRFYAPFSWHPWGHWASGLAANLDTAGALDVIQAFQGETALARTSHRAQFNQAFGQTRTATFHTPSPDYDIAPMASAGIWRFA